MLNAMEWICPWTSIIWSRKVERNELCFPWEVLQRRADWMESPNSSCISHCWAQKISVLSSYSILVTSSQKKNAMVCICLMAMKTTRRRQSRTSKYSPECKPFYSNGCLSIFQRLRTPRLWLDFVSILTSMKMKIRLTSLKVWERFGLISMHGDQWFRLREEECRWWTTTFMY